MGTEGEQTRSVFNGKIDGIPKISVDNLEPHTYDKVLAYFVSHMHTDHTQGLFGSNPSSQLYVNGAPIYMSEKSAVYLRHNHWHYGNIAALVEPLKTGLTYTIDIPNDASFQVTLIPVKHMIGAVMFLFRTADKTILYTGDFVIEKEEIKDIRELHNKDGTPIKIDKIYVDATFDNPDYEEFPRREDCHRELIERAREWLKDENHRLALYSNYRFGYDDLYKALHSALGIKIFLHDKNIKDVYAMYRDLYQDDNFVTNDSCSQIHVCRNKSPQDNHNGNGDDDCKVQTAMGKKYLLVTISAQRGYYYQRGEASNSALSKNENGDSYYLCYPTHCSRKQLNDFLDYFKHKEPTKFPATPVKTSSVPSPYKKQGGYHNSTADRVKRNIQF